MGVALACYFDIVVAGEAGAGKTGVIKAGRRPSRIGLVAVFACVACHQMRLRFADSWQMCRRVVMACKTHSRVRCFRVHKHGWLECSGVVAGIAIV